MSAFQPGDVVRLTGEQVEELVRQSMASGLAWMADNIDVMRHKRDASLTDILGDWAAQFLAIRPDLLGSTDTPATLSPQAVLDAILDGIANPYYNHADCHHMMLIGTTTITARKVDGHWQVKSVGGGE